MAPVLQEAGIPMVATTSTNPQVTAVGDCIFRACFTDDFQGRVLARFALEELQARTAVLMTNTDNAYSTALARYFREPFARRGRVLAELEYLQETSDFRVQLEQVLRLAPDVLFVPGYHRDSGFIIKQARAMGITATGLGGDGWDEAMYEYAGDSLEGAYYSEQWHHLLPEQRNRAFVEDFARRHGLPRAGLTALSYDAAGLVIDAIRRAGPEPAPAAIRAALAATRAYPGITGDITFDAQGDPIGKPAVILRWTGGRAVYHRSYAAGPEPPP